MTSGPFRKASWVRSDVSPTREQDLSSIIADDGEDTDLMRPKREFTSHFESLLIRIMYR